MATRNLNKFALRARSLGDTVWVLFREKDGTKMPFYVKECRLVNIIQNDHFAKIYETDGNGRMSTITVSILDCYPNKCEADKALERELSLMEQICWRCENAVPGAIKKDGTCTGCPWSRAFKPVPGWTATPRKIAGDVETFDIYACPMFIEG